LGCLFVIIELRVHFRFPFFVSGAIFRAFYGTFLLPTHTSQSRISNISLGMTASFSREIVSLPVLWSMIPRQFIFLGVPASYFDDPPATRVAEKCASGNELFVTIADVSDGPPFVSEFSFLRVFYRQGSWMAVSSSQTRRCLQSTGASGSRGKRMRTRSRRA